MNIRGRKRLLSVCPYQQILETIRATKILLREDQDFFKIWHRLWKTCISAVVMKKVKKYIYGVQKCSIPLIRINGLRYFPFCAAHENCKKSVKCKKCSTGRDQNHHWDHNSPHPGYRRNKGGEEPTRCRRSSTQRSLGSHAYSKSISWTHKHATHTQAIGRSLHLSSLWTSSSTSGSREHQGVRVNASGHARSWD